MISPAIPAAASRCPRFVFTEPTTSGDDRPLPSTAPSALSSIGSPKDVPVPCASTYETSDGSTPARTTASRISASCAGPFGTVKPPLRPSWFTAVARITARTRSPSAKASDRRFRTTTPHPSLLTYPSADASKALHRPSRASIRALARTTFSSGKRRTFTPPTMATRLSPIRRLWQAKCTATSDDEHAVSTDRLGPCNPSTYDSRPAAALMALPVPK